MTDGARDSGFAPSASSVSRCGLSPAFTCDRLPAMCGQGFGQRLTRPARIQRFPSGICPLFPAVKSCPSRRTGGSRWSTTDLRRAPRALRRGSPASVPGAA